MKPRNKTEKHILKLSKKVPKLGKRFKKYAKEKMPKNIVSHYSSFYCLECGHNYKEGALSVKLLGSKCPNCNTDLEYTDHYHNGFVSHDTYFEILTTYENYQVVRLIYLRKISTKKGNPDYIFIEAMQSWIDDKGKTYTLTARTIGMSYYYDAWISGTKLEFRTNSTRHNNQKALRSSYIYKNSRIQPIVFRNGYNLQNVDAATPAFISAILTNNKIETLVKANQLKIASHYVYNPSEKLNKRWRQLIIAIRNNYIIDDPSIWYDYIDFLEHFNKDINSPKYLCPINLHKAHNKYLEKKRKIDNAIAFKIKRAKMAKDEKAYFERKKKYLDLIFKIDNLTISPLQSVSDFAKEEEALKHCVFSRDYYKKRDSLLFSAKIKGERIETIELSLKTFNILQSRGLLNQPTEYNYLIDKLMNKNISKIRKLA